MVCRKTCSDAYVYVCQRCSDAYVYVCQGGVSEEVLVRLERLWSSLQLPSSSSTSSTSTETLTADPPLPTGAFCFFTMLVLLVYIRVRIRVRIRLRLLGSFVLGCTRSLLSWSMIRYTLLMSSYAIRSSHACSPHTLYAPDV